MWKLTKPLSLFFAIIVIAGHHAFGQEDTFLDQYIREALEQNITLKQKQMAYEQSTYAVRGARARFLPNVSLDASYMWAKGGRSIFFPAGDLLNPVYQTLNTMTDSQRFPEDVENFEEQFLPDGFHDSKIRISQPLFNTSIYHQLHVVKYQSLAEEAAREAYQASLVKDVKVAYYQYLQAQELLNVHQQTSSLIEQLKRQNESLVANDKVGLEATLEIDYEIKQNEKNIFIAQQKVNASRKYFNLLLNRPLDHEVLSNTQVPPDQLSLPIDTLNLSQRAEIKQLDHLIAAADQAINLHHAKYLPDIHVGADIGYQGFGYEINSDQSYWLIKASLRWTLPYGWKNRAEVQEAKVQMNILQHEMDKTRQEMKYQTEKYHEEIQASIFSYEAANAALTLAERLFFIERKKQKEGLANLTLWMEAKTRLENARVRKVIDYYNYLIALAQWEWSNSN